jgi:hypothetical protein
MLACTHVRTSAARDHASGSVCYCECLFDACFHEIDDGSAWKPSSSSIDCYLRPSRKHASVMGDIAKI